MLVLAGSRFPARHRDQRPLVLAGNIWQWASPRSAGDTTPDIISKTSEYLTKSWLIPTRLRPLASLVRVRGGGGDREWRVLCCAWQMVAVNCSPPPLSSRHLSFSSSPFCLFLRSSARVYNPRMIHLHAITRNNQSLIFWGGQSTSCCNYLINAGVPYDHDPPPFVRSISLRPQEVNGCVWTTHANTFNFLARRASEPVIM